MSERVGRRVDGLREHPDELGSAPAWVVRRTLGVGMAHMEALETALQAWESMSRRVVTLDERLTPPELN